LIQTLGGDDRTLYIELIGNRLSLGLVALICGLMLLASVSVLRVATNKLILLFFALQGLVCGIFLTDDLFNLFVLLEVTTLVMVLLNVFDKRTRVVYDALYYLVIQIVGMAFFLLGIAFVYRATGLLSVSAIASGLGGFTGSPMSLIAPFALIMTGLGLKVGLFPLFSFIPRFYSNPGAPAAVLMFSSSVVSTACLFWIARIIFAFSPLNTSKVMVAIGLLTTIAGGAKAIMQSDTRLLLAFSTVSQAGLAMMALGLGTSLSTAGFMAHLFTHALAKALLFFSASTVFQSLGTWDVSAFSARLWRTPSLAVASIIGAASLIGMPLTAGSWSKYWIQSGAGSGGRELFIWISTAVTICIMVRFLGARRRRSPSAAVTTGTPAATLKLRKVDSLLQSIVLFTLVAAIILVGVFGPFLFEGILGASSPGMAFGTAILKLGQLSALTAIAVLINRYLARRVIAPLRPILTGSFALPDAALMLALFFAGILVAGLVRGVM
jgi:multicomponent Na+:H+ antiporter subunit D